MSDGLPTVWRVEPHTLAKHEILKQYLDAWMPILSRQAEKVGSSVPLWFVDGFAGPGVYSEGEPGSPIVALRAALNHVLDFPVPIRFTFIEEDRERCNRLKGELQQFAPQLAASIDVQLDPVACGECEPVLSGKIAEREKAHGQVGPALFFLDQFGYSAVPMKLIARILRHPQCEVFSYFGWRELGRFISDESKWPAISAAFGGDTWKQAIDLPHAKRDAFLQEEYKRCLRSSGGARYVWSFAMTDASGRLLYWLMFGTNSLRGLEEMKEAMWKVDDGGTFRFSDRDGFDQLKLFAAFTDSWLAGELHRRLGGRTMTVAEVQEYVLTNTPCYLWKKALAKLERDNALKVVGASAGRKTPSFTKPTMIIRFDDPPMF